MLAMMCDYNIVRYDVIFVSRTMPPRGRIRGRRGRRQPPIKGRGRGGGEERLLQEGLVTKTKATASPQVVPATAPPPATPATGIDL